MKKQDLVRFENLASTTEFNLMSMMAQTESIVSSTNKLIDECSKITSIRLPSDGSLIGKTYELISESRKIINGDKTPTSGNSLMFHKTRQLIAEARRLLNNELIYY